MVGQRLATSLLARATMLIAASFLRESEASLEYRYVHQIKVAVLQLTGPD